MQQEGSAASSSDPLKREIPSVLTKSKSNETIDPPLPQSSAGEGGAAAALGADEEDANIRKDAEFPESAATEEDHPHKHSLKNDGEAKKEKTAFGPNNTANKNDGYSDGSTAVSHTTSPLLPLLVAMLLLLRWWPRESEGERAVHRPHTHSSFSLCVCVPLHGLSPSPHPTKHTQ
ncbi:mucin-associated surface protein (MASP) [Trypanosoma cruzi]|nr:mucin-associated surface protein (MASP) [Trypanosoma cruzi]